jgi:hypothetical protein
MISFELLHPKATSDYLGLIPHFLYETNPEPAAIQINRSYEHGGGWRPMPKWQRTNPDSFIISYPGDDLLYSPIAKATLHADDPTLPTEIICIYQSAWVAIFQENGSFEVARID